jgi:1-pyrroline-2-carboxylate reductase [NAD(P)H]
VAVKLGWKRLESVENRPTYAAEMRVITAAEVNAALRYPEFIDALEATFARSYVMPPRQVMLLDEVSGSHDAFAMLPAWNDEVIALKAFTYFPQNLLPLRTLYSQIMLFDRGCGEPRAMVDGVSVTCWRTAGVSALASRFLSRVDSRTLLLLGTGKLASFLIRAHVSVRPLGKVLIWGRSTDKAAKLVGVMKAEFPEIEFQAVADLAAACGQADIVVCATGSQEILVHGEWIAPGTHTDFLGNHHATKRECDTSMVTRSRVFVDTRVNCFKEAGEILVPVAEGVFSTDQVAGELSELCRRSVPPRQDDVEITLFKSVGCALGDLCGAATAWNAVRE